MTSRPPLLPRVAAGDSAAAKECIERFGGLVWALARRHTPSGPDAEDAVQDIFVDLWRSAARFDPERSTEPAFVAMVARRRLIDLSRRRVRREEELVEAVVSKAPVVEESAVVGQALGLLDPREREVLVLTAFDGLTQQEIAKEKGLPLGTVKTIARRGLLRMRALLSGDDVPVAPSAEVEP
ncbi:MAG: sigma-70 family RNA polymerase sigma factor [Polyangiaceae bacterium]